MDPTTQASLRFDHLHRLSGRHGVFEHALYDRPRRSHGYTTDDMARVLVVLGRAVMLDPATSRLFEGSIEFVIAGRLPRGWHNRMSASGRWVDRRGSDDAHGRALWGLGVALGAAPPHLHDRIVATLTEGVDLDSPAPRANAFGVLGTCAAIHHLGPSTPNRIVDALHGFLNRVPGPASEGWRWPEARLAYANGRLPEALLAAGATLGEDTLVEQGLLLLDWLVAVERSESGFSFTPVAGRGPTDTGAGFDQQPIEAWAMADACSRAAWITGDDEWSEHTAAAAEWFLGSNDLGVALYDPETGAGYDGLHRDRVNANRGAESTLAALGALQTRIRHEHGLPPE